MQTGQQPRELGEGVRDDSSAFEGDARGEPDSAEGDVILGLVSIGTHDTIGAGGHRRGYMMGLVDTNGRKFYVDISEQTYQDLVGIYALSVQKHQDVSMSSVMKAPEPEPEVGLEPTGTEEEVQQMQQLLQEATGSGDIMKKLGFVSDEDMQRSQPAMPAPMEVDPVEDLLSMASSDEDDDYEDPGEESFDEGMESI